jgi:hypothetical protein
MVALMTLFARVYLKFSMNGRDVSAINARGTIFDRATYNAMYIINIITNQGKISTRKIFIQIVFMNKTHNTVFSLLFQEIRFLAVVYRSGSLSEFGCWSLRFSCTVIHVQSFHI